MDSPPKFFGVIPARYASSRFPGKPLAQILGRPMFWHVYERAARCPELERVVLATDDQRILVAAENLGVPALMTARGHQSGTDRVLEAARLMELPGDCVVLNIQGDEPALDPAMLSELVGPFVSPEVRVSTLARRIGPEEVKSPDRVKVVVDRRGRALYFSRAAIPFGRDGGHLLHLGLYALRMETLEMFASLSRGPLELREGLEQLRLLENGVPVQVIITEHRCLGVDRPEDLEAATRMILEQRQ
ncbi:MAG: 3-deoxy-manno-octulosonate cytidylyltransferase [Desulfovibrionaceae bacterium]|nr:3-deoxy-manno-octulosonate cytidylyltransferase [Desulfovibrionaceae bacterium]